jgi:hypothetical protein
MARPELDLEDLKHQYLTDDRLENQIRYWFPGRNVEDFYVEVDWYETYKADNDMMPGKQLVDKRGMYYVAWFDESSIMVPYNPPIKVPHRTRSGGYY